MPARSGFDPVPLLTRVPTDTAATPRDAQPGAAKRPLMELTEVFPGSNKAGATMIQLMEYNGLPPRQACRAPFASQVGGGVTDGVEVAEQKMH